MKYLLLFCAILAEVAGTTALKQSDGFTRPIWGFASMVGYGIAFYFLSLTLRTIPAGVAYAIWSGVGIVLIFVSASLFLGQKPDFPAILGMALIVAGVAIMSAFSQMSVH